VTTETLRHAERLWHYLSRREPPRRSDAIVVCCSYDLRVGDHACDLLQAGLAPVLVFSGNTGNWTRHIWSRPEAHVFRDRALERGVPAQAILIEDRATNFGENVRFAREMLPQARSAIFVTKPGAVLRLALTVPAQWPGVQACVDAPPLRFPDDVSQVVGVLGLIAEMVGDVQRIAEYPALGFQVPHPLPADVQASWQALVAAGFDGHLLRR
jgi:uncharacterized SAM-binding protein YcdF (DUF218 family)